MNKSRINMKLTLATAIVILVPFFAASALAADEKSPSTAATPAPRGSDKVDLKKLEDKYWSAKDDEYGVIQNRTFAKTGKYYGSLVYGPLLNDQFAKSRATGGMLGYYLTEDFGVEFSYLSYDSKQNDNVNGILALGGSPSYNLLKANKSISLTYTPFYAKMAFMNKAILYFDMGFTIGAGMTDYEVQKVVGTGVDSPANETKSAPHVEIGIMQQLFISKNFAFRADIKNTFYTQKMQQYKAASESVRTETNKNVNDTTITFGLTLFTN
ncbi:MAG: outer membrane beta-barrel domain-containing protein [Bdellovibrio sp.]|nr:outer membrane beta-barrel domain-containing protein [Bdellovibrio sp.]